MVIISMMIKSFSVKLTNHYLKRYSSISWNEKKKQDCGHFPDLKSTAFVAPMISYATNMKYACYVRLGTWQVPGAKFDFTLGTRQKRY